MPEFTGWRDSVRFTAGGMSYRPEEVLVPEAVRDLSLSAVDDAFPDASVEGEDLSGGWVKITGSFDALDALGRLRAAGVFAQPNHVFFANVCCPPHPSTLGPGANPFLANPFLANPFLANPFLANPFLANPFLANPFGGGCCCCGGGDGLAAKPFLANTNPNPAAIPRIQATGRRKSSARPAGPPGAQGEVAPSEKAGIRIAILDTGFAESHEPTGLGNMTVHKAGGDNPDEDGDGYLDPVAGHGTFIAGVIEQLAPGCELEVHEVLTTYGDGDEARIAAKLFELSSRPDGERPQVVNMSFGAYTPIGVGYLAEAIDALHRQGVILVASAGNEATCIPTYPAALPHVISVGALDQDGWPSEYTNYGPWVRACTIGTDVTSIFFHYQGAEPKVDGVDIDEFEGWARWSGTSFAAPRVVAALALELRSGRSAAQAVKALIDDEKAPKKPMLGTVVLT